MDRLSVIRCATDKVDVKLRTLGFIRRLPLIAGNFKDVVRHNHRERGTLLLIPLPDTLAAYLDGGIEYMNHQVVPFALNAATEVNARGLLNKTQLKDDPAAAIKKAFAVLPDEFNQSLFPLDIPRENVLFRTIRAVNRGKPFIQSDMDSATI